MAEVSKPWAVAVRLEKECYATERENIEKEEYITVNNGKPKFYTASDALFLKKYRTEEFEKLIFTTLKFHSKDRKKLTPVDAQSKYFKFPPGTNKGSSSDSDGESLSHELAIIALSFLSKLNFKISDREENRFWKNKNIKLVCTENEVEPSLVLSGSKQYRPDLLYKFDESQELYPKWGGKLALEVKYKHEVPAKKRWDFENHSIPIIEFVLTDELLFQPEVNNESFTGDDIDSHIEYLIATFASEIPNCDMKSDPISVRWYAGKLKEFKENKKALSEDLQALELMCKNLKQQLNDVKGTLNFRNSEYEMLQRSSADLQKKLEIRSRENKQAHIEYEANSEESTAQVGFWRIFSAILVLPYLALITWVIYVNYVA